MHAYFGPLGDQASSPRAYFDGINIPANPRLPRGPPSFHPEISLTQRVLSYTYTIHLLTFFQQYIPKMTSMAAAIAATLPAAIVPSAIQKAAQEAAAKNASNSATAQVPQRMEGLIDVEGARGVDSVALGSLVCSPFCIDEACI